MYSGSGQGSRRPLEGPQRAEEASTRVITTVFVALLIDLLGFTLILPLLPSILDHYSKNDDGLYNTLQHGVDRFAEAVGVPPERKYNSVLFGGLIGSIFSILQFFASPLTGAASDHFGRRPLMLLTVMGLIASYSLWAISRSFELFLLSRVIGGISKGNVSLSTAIIADLACPKARSKGMAMIGVAFSLGFTLGPMLGAYLAMETEKGEVFYLRSALFAVMFAVADLAFIFFLLPETLPKEKRVSSVTSGFQSVAGLLSPWALFQFSAVSQRMDPPSKKNLKILGLVYFLYLFLFSGLEYTLSFLVHQHFQFSSMQQGKMFFFIGITMAIIQGGYTRQIKLGNELKTVKRAILLSIPAFLLIGWSGGMVCLSAGLLLYSFAAAAVVPCLSAVVSGYGEKGSFNPKSEIKGIHLDLPALYITQRERKWPQSIVIKVVLAFLFTIYYSGTLFRQRTILLIGSTSQKGAVMGILRSLGALARATGPVLSAAVYWLAGAEVCFTSCASLFFIPLLLLGCIQERTKEE